MTRVASMLKQWLSKIRGGGAKSNRSAKKK
jgi:hypothetical protein